MQPSVPRQVSESDLLPLELLVVQASRPFGILPIADVERHADRFLVPETAGRQR